MLKNNKREKAVSPIVGVILMIVFTIILAGVVTQFGLELGDILEQPVTAGVSIQESYNVQDGTYDVRLVWSSSGTVDTIYANEPDGSQTPSISEVGESIVVEDVEPGERITIIGSRSSGETGIIQEYTVG